MEKLLLYTTCICYMALHVTAIPIYAGEKSNINDIYELCNSAAIQKVNSGSADNLSDFLLSMRSGNDVNAIMFALSRSEGNDFPETPRNKLSDFGKDNQLREILDSLNDLRKACVFEYISGKRQSDNMKKDAEKYEALDSNNFSDLRRSSLLSAESGRFSQSVKRDRAAIGLNPTGWRRRRSDVRDHEDVTKFLRNMRELLEKRERLSFNPTGW